MKVSLVMVTWNAGALLTEVLDSVIQQRAVAFDELIAVDSGSRDGTVDVLLAHGFRVATIPNGDFNHGSTRDVGIEMATGDVVVLLVQDATLVGDDWLQKMLAPFADPDVAGVWSRQVARPDCQPVLARRISEWPGWGSGVTKQALQPGERLADLAPRARLMRCAFDNVASAVRREVWSRFRFGPRRYGEDVFFGKRVIEAGLALVHQGDALVVHSHSRSPWDEGRCTFCDHRNLRELFGLASFSSWADVRSAIRGATPDFLDYVRGLGLPRHAEIDALRWTRAYVRWQCWGQYLGSLAGARLSGWRGRFLRLLGAWIERGL